MPAFPSETLCRFVLFENLSCYYLFHLFIWKGLVQLRVDRGLEDSLGLPIVLPSPSKVGLCGYGPLSLFFLT